MVRVAGDRPQSLPRQPARWRTHQLRRIRADLVNHHARRHRGYGRVDDLLRRVSPLDHLVVVMLYAMGRHHPRTSDESEPLDPARLCLAAFAAAMLVLSFTPVPLIES